MKTHLIERFVKAAGPAPARNIIVRDDEVIGFGVRVTTAGAKSFVLSYTIAGRKKQCPGPRCISEFLSRLNTII